jgi:queuine tRNA-ribosyltransferase
MSHRLTFEIEASSGHARAGRLTLTRGSFETPVFMPVGTLATVKAMTAAELETLGFRILLANAYHLMLRPGADVVERCGGLQRFMAWPGLVLTDSGGFQIFSLRALRRIDDRGVEFRSHVDGSAHFLDPEGAMRLQARLGSDIAMALDQCPPSHAPHAEVAQAVARTTLWAKRFLTVEPAPHQARFGIVQGGLDPALRLAHLEEIAALPFDGLALGGLSVGESPAEMYELLEAVAPRMPADRPRYLMGVGHPEDLVVAIGRGIDLFDCVMPTRNARNGQLFTSRGKLVISNARHREDPSPPDPGCSCETCRTASRAYLRHLHNTKEILYSRLATLHNLAYLRSVVARARQAIGEGRYAAFEAEFRGGPEGRGAAAKEASEAK